MQVLSGGTILLHENFTLQPGSSEIRAQEVPGGEVSFVNASVMSENCSGLQS